MKWKEPMLPKNAKRTLRKFAWYPVTLSDGTSIWLEWYYANQEVWLSKREWYTVDRFQKYPCDSFLFAHRKRILSLDEDQSLKMITFGDEKDGSDTIVTKYKITHIGTAEIEPSQLIFTIVKDN